MPKLTVIKEGEKSEIVFDGAVNLWALLTNHGLVVDRPCGGQGTCGKCAVFLASKGKVLACQTSIDQDDEVVLPQKQDMVQIQMDQCAVHDVIDPMQGDYGASVDIGTTTIVMTLWGLQTGTCLSQRAMSNPQTAIAADVMGRIGASMNGYQDLLKEEVTHAIEGLLDACCKHANIARKEVQSMVLTGNTTMLYLLTGRDPKALSHAPFEADCLFGEMIDVLGIQSYLPKCMNAFVGADISCAVLSSGMCEKSQTSLLCDIGTNGEMALWHKGQLFVTSTAAGPAFEGAGIVCGVGSVAGAIDRVGLDGKQVVIHTILDKPPVGLCGSGLIDAVSVCLQIEAVDETGAMEEECFPLSENVALYPQDIRQVQLAKGAIATGIQLLMEEANVLAQEVETLYIAGGFGSHLNIQSAVQMGLIPEAFRDCVKVIGNASLAGAQLLLFDQNRYKTLNALINQAVAVHLGGHPRFNDCFMEKMMFEL